ncbi:MAG: hypothetical protein ABRQ24_10845 [Syntrophomonadaceae bacterium]
MNINLMANILIVATVVFIAFWLVWLLGLMNRPGTSARKPMDEANRSYGEDDDHRKDEDADHRDQ